MKFTIQSLEAKDVQGKNGVFTSIKIKGDNGTTYKAFSNNTTKQWAVGSVVDLPDEYFKEETWDYNGKTYSAVKISFPKPAGFGGGQSGVGNDLILAKLNAMALDIKAIKERLEENSMPSQLTDDSVPF